MKITKEQINEVKARGFLLNKGTENFSGRIVAPGTVFSFNDFCALSEIAEKFGNGKLICTSRLCVEIPGINYYDIEKAEKYASERGLSFGGTGPKVRPITACKGTTCVYGNCDTHKLALLIHNEFYIGYKSVKFPHKVKISVGGCPNSCMKPSLNDFGVEAHKIPKINPENCRGCRVCFVSESCPMKAFSVEDNKIEIASSCLDCGVCVGKCPFNAVDKESETVYKIYVGGTWGKRTRMGTAYSRYVKEDEILTVLEKTLLWFKENGLPKERLGMTIDRLGIDKFEKAINSDDLINRKEEILNK